MKRVFLFIGLGVAMGIFPGAASVHHAPVQLKGTVVQEGSGRPVEKAYVVVVSGEEEVLTGRDGSFVLTTWQSLPAVIVIQHPDFRTEKLAIEDNASRSFLVRLKLK